MLSVIIHFLVIIGINSQQINWFKKTPTHFQNIQKLVNGWEECPEWKALSVASEITLFSFGSTNKMAIPAQNNSLYNITALCITLQVPLNWDDKKNATNATIDYYIARLFSGFDPNNTNGHGAFWVLQGGPGASGSTLFPISIPVMNFFDDKFDLYIPDHRGTGHSNYLDCNFTSGYKSCAKDINDTYGDTSYFSTYAASMDLGYAVDLFQKKLKTYNSTNDLVYGVSYGTYYLNQYLTLFPNQFKASIFDSLTSPQFRFSQYGNDTNKAGLLFLQRCHENEFCNQLFAELNTTIFDAINSSFTSLSCMKDNNNTQNSTNSTSGSDLRGELRSALFASLANVHKRVLIPPMVYRMFRCNKDDYEAVDKFLAYASGESALSNISWLVNATTNVTTNVTFVSTSAALYSNIVFSELWDSFNTSDPGPTYEELVEFESKSYFSPSVSNLRKLWDDWIRYTPKPEIFYKYADPPIPMLLFGSGLDPQTHIKYSIRSARQYRARMGNRMDNISNTTTNRYFYEFPDAPHASIITSLIKNFTDSTLEHDHNLETCALYIMKSFIDPNNNYTPNSDCLSWLTPIDWNGTSNISQELGLKAFGTTDLWGSQAVNASAAPTQSPLPGNLTNPPTVSPTKKPTATPTDKEKAWMITGIVFICLFAIALIVIAYLAYVLNYSDKKVSDSQGNYTKANNTDVEVGNLKTTVAEDSD